LSFKQFFCLPNEQAQFDFVALAADLAHDRFVYRGKVFACEACGNLGGVFVNNVLEPAFLYHAMGEILRIQNVAYCLLKLFRRDRPKHVIVRTTVGFDEACQASGANGIPKVVRPFVLNAVVRPLADVGHARADVALKEIFQEFAIFPICVGVWFVIHASCFHEPKRSAKTGHKLRIIKMVRAVGIEPTHLAVRDFESARIALKCLFSLTFTFLCVRTV
jgi:hypothetical protein